MRGIIIRFFTMDILNDHPAVYWGLALIWVILLVAAISSLRSLHVSGKVKAFWLAIILLIPIVGMALYSIRCLIKADWSGLKPFLLPQNRGVRSFLSSSGQVD
jgi:hypothetical protein